MTQQEAYDLLPTDAVWSCSFGNPGETGFTEYHRTPSGERWVITNGPRDHWLVRPTAWTCEKTPPAMEKSPG